MTNTENFDDGLTQVAEKITELKTLKDLETFWDGDSYFDEAVELKELKAEAIKWVKKHRDKNMDCCWNKPITECWGMGKDFIEFHNITDEDLLK